MLIKKEARHVQIGHTRVRLDLLITQHTMSIVYTASMISLRSVDPSGTTRTHLTLTLTLTYT